MSWRDDEDEEPLSTRRALERADHRTQEKKDALTKKKVEREHSKQKLKRDMFQKQVHGSVMLHKDTSTPQTFGPKTVEEKAEAQFKAQSEQNVTPEELMDQAEEQKREEEEAKQEEQTSNPD